MRTIPAALAEHLAGEATTVCRAWRVTRRDGTVFGFTDHDRDLAFIGTSFLAQTGFDRSETTASLGLQTATDDVVGAFSAEAITEKDLNDGRFDGARVEVFAVNWQAPEQHVLLRTQEIGEVTSDGQSFRTELRSLASRLEQVQGRVYARGCDAALGDARCTVDLDDPAFSGTGSVVSAGDASACLVAGLAGFADHWFRFGLVRWTSGDNAGLSTEIEDQVAGEGGATLTFWVPAENRPQPGDTFSITAGCDKSFATCGAKFSNRLNFQGFPHLPGADFAYGYADSRTVHDGRPLVK